MSENPDQQAGPGAPAPLPPQVERSRLGGVWLALVLGAVVLVLLLVFILMNGQRVQIHLYGANVTAPLGVALISHVTRIAASGPNVSPSTNRRGASAASIR